MVGRLFYESSVFVRVRGKIGYFGMQIVILVLNKYLEIISLCRETPKFNMFKWEGFLNFIKCVYRVCTLFYYFMIVR